MRISRADQSRIATWWFTVDRLLLVAVLALVGAGIVLSLAASPSVAAKKGLAAYHFVERHLLFAGAGVVAMIAVSLLTPQAVRRLALVLLAIAVGALAAMPWLGEEINGARRWLPVMGHSLQPSEFAKPAFVVVSAWLFAEARRRPEMPALALAVALAIVLAALLIVQPDVGQTMLVAAVWGALYFASGQPLAGGLALLGVAAAGLGVAYAVFPHVRVRFEQFFGTGGGDNSQVERAIQSFTEGGFFGRGPGEGTIKTVLPDAHTDFILAVVAEEYGVIACLFLLALFAFVVLRAIVHAAREPEDATRLAITGLALIIGLQALINMGVNVGLLPAKGMTLPFISAGGSSALAVSITAGMLLALTRRRPGLERLRPPRLAPMIEADRRIGEAIRPS